MAFGRSNSLSINTASSPSLFGNTPANPSQLQSQSQSQSQSTSQPTSLFGNTATSSQQPQQQSTSLFGNTATASQQPQQQSNSLFGNSNNNTAQTQQPSTSLFGNSSTTQPQQTTSLFGANNNTSQPQTTSLFGANNNNNNNTNQPQQQSGSLFGGILGQSNQTQNQNQSQQAGGGLFGQNNTANNTSSNNSLFGTSTAQQPQNMASSLFNLGASTTAPLVGSLTMGQSTAPQSTTPGTKIDLSNLRPTTRFSDLHDDLKKQIEAIDAFIRQQESYSSQCEALLPNHSANVDSLKPDVQLITAKIDTVELALENDSRTIETAKALVKRDATDLMRCARVIENLTLPSQYHYGPSVSAARTRASSSSTNDDYDVDLVGYFMRQADAMQSTLDTYTSNLTEIENHLRVIEHSTIHQAQQLAAQRTGGRASTGQDTVRELADTLRGFENGILGAAGLVGSCREGVNDLVMGKIDARDSQGHGTRKSVRF